MSSRTLWKSSGVAARAQSPTPPRVTEIDWLPPDVVAAAVYSHNERAVARQKKQKNSVSDRKTHTYMGRGGRNGAMDALASTALAAGNMPSYQHRHGASAVSGMIHGERPSKRVKSERYFLQTDPREGRRPATSYVQHASRPSQEDAQLLLDLFNGPRNSSPTSKPKSHAHVRSVSFGQAPTFHRPQMYQTSHEPLPHYQSSSDRPSPRQDGVRAGNSRPQLRAVSEGQHGVDGLQSLTEATAVAWPQKASSPHSNGVPTISKDTNKTKTEEMQVDRPTLQTEENQQNAQQQTSKSSTEACIPSEQNEHDTISSLSNGRLPTASTEAGDLATSRDPADEVSSHDSGIFPKGIAKQEQTAIISQEDQYPNSAPIAGQTQTTLDEKKKKMDLPTAKASEALQVCAACNFHRNSLTLETEDQATSWIICDGCNRWFHFACAGFKSEREVRSVDKFRCKTCKPIHGPTTYVRKSARAHTAIDYAELNQGVVKTSEESPEHHYIKPIKEGTIKFTPENFARIRPELVTTDFWLHGEGMKEPVVIPAAWNPRPKKVPRPEEAPEDMLDDPADDAVLHDQSALESDISDQYEYEQVPNVGQDLLDMVIPQGLTVRQVAELYGPDEKLEVIDVKSQNGEDKRWNMRKWVDYYESKDTNKPVRNVISLEVSQSKLGELIKRPKVVRDLDLQDAVWPAELMAKGEFPKVQFYCLMSVADCYTDFHIDFGGSSVYYHILRGKKTFFFIPPTEPNLKKYEDWCNSDAQNYTFLGDQTKICHRVDLSEGDTMLIPAGWIHAVWTPEDSLVIGGNFLTRQNYSMQIRITQIEKATNVARKFRYPHFQKVMWYTMVKYLNEDPIPQSVIDTLLSGKPFVRETPTHDDYDAWGEYAHSGPGTEGYHARYYAKCELAGVPELMRYIQRTAYIAAGYVTDGVTSDTKRAVQRSIPKEYKQHGAEPVDAVRKFAMWYCWKRGNELLPHWAYPDYTPEVNAPEVTQKKLSAAHIRRLEREAAMSAERVSDRPQRERKQPSNLYNEMMTEQDKTSIMKSATPPENEFVKWEGIDCGQAQITSDAPTSSKKETQTRKRKSIGSVANRQPACDTCRRGRRACKHRDLHIEAAAEIPATFAAPTAPMVAPSSAIAIPTMGKIVEGIGSAPSTEGPATSNVPLREYETSTAALSLVEQPQSTPQPTVEDTTAPMPNGISLTKESSTPGRSKACADCRKSKRRCIHDEFGRQDPIKMAQAAMPRPAAKKKRTSSGTTDSRDSKKSRKLSSSTRQAPARTHYESDEQSSAPVALMGTMISTADIAPQQSISIMPSEAPSQPYEEVRLISSMHEQEQKHDVKVNGSTLAMSVLKQDTSSALVSPPDSTRMDAERTASPVHTPGPGVSEAAGPPNKTGIMHNDNKAKELTPPTTVSAPRSRRTSQLLPVNPARSAKRQSPEQVRSRAMSTASVESGLPRGSSKRRESNAAMNDADEETMRLIRKMTAQDRGLRRRESRTA